MSRGFVMDQWSVESSKGSLLLEWTDGVKEERLKVAEGLERADWLFKIRFILAGGGVGVGEGRHHQGNTN